MGSQIVGKARIQYTTTAGSTVTVLLGSPLHELEGNKQITTFVAESLNKQIREVVSIPGGRFRLKGVVRFHDDLRELLDLIDHGTRGNTMTYYHTTAASGVVCYLEQGPLSDSVVRADRELAGKGYYETELTLTTASTNAFNEVW